jgi:thioredoxin reductase
MTDAQHHDVDVLIVGAGPTGLYAGYYAGFRGLRIAIADMLELPGGQITALYPEKKIFDVAGFPEVLGRELVDRLVKQVEPFNPIWILGTRVDGLARNDERWDVTLSSGATVTTTIVVITGGIGTFEPRALPVGREYEGRGLIYYVPQPQALAGKRVVIVGGGDSAFDWALALEPICPSVALVHRRDAFRAHEHTIDLVTNSSTKIITNAEVTAISGADNLTSVEITTKAGDVIIHEADVVVAALGFVAHLGPLAEWGLEMSKRTIITDSSMRTNLPGVFAAGDITEYPGKVRLISVGFGEAALAVNNAMTVIDPTKSAFPGHSSENS